MGARISRQERQRAERRGYKRFIEQEQERLEQGVFDEEGTEHVEKRIAEYEERIAELDDEIGGDHEDKILDDDRYPEDVEDDVYESDEDAMEEGFSSKREGEEHWRNLREELYEQGNLGARVECQVAEDMAGEGISMNDIIEDTVKAFQEVQEEMWHEFGV